MTPTLSSYHPVDAWAAYPELSGNGGACFTGCDTGSDGDHVSFGECGVWVAAADVTSAGWFPSKNTEAVQSVCGGCDDLKVTEAVVIFDAVDVVDDEPVRYRANERFNHDPMELFGDIGSPAVLDAKNGIAIFIPAALHQSIPPADQQSGCADLVAGASCGLSPLIIVIHSAN